MDKFRIDIYRKLINDNIKSADNGPIFSGTFQSNKEVEKIVDKLHNQEGLAIDLIKPQNEIPVIRLDYLGGQDISETIDWLKNNNSLVSEDNDDFEMIFESNSILSLGEMELDEAESEELLTFLTSEFSSDVKSITKTISIFELGASGYFVDFIINLVAGFSQSGLMKLTEFLKSKGHEYYEMNQFEIGKVKNFISKNYGVNPNLLKLTSTRTYENNQTRFTFSSRYADYIVEVDNKYNVIESSIRQFSQTNI